MKDIERYLLKSKLAQQYHPEMKQSEIFQFMWEWDSTCEKINKHIKWVKGEIE